MTSLFRTWLPASQRQMLRRMRDQLNVRLARVFLFLCRALPLAAQARLKSELQPVGRLDYPSAKLQLMAGSPWQHYRLNSCAKEPETVRWLEQKLQAQDVLYDIGANVGAYSLVAFHITQGQALVYAFEPVPATFAVLSQNILFNQAQGRVIPLPLGLSDQTGLFNLAYSALEAGAAQHSWQTSAEVFQPTPCYRLDDLIPALGLPLPTLLKVDVDGPEFQVLQGAEQTLRSPGLRSLLIEMTPDQIEGQTITTFLLRLGFVEQKRQARDQLTGLFNVIFER